MDTNLTAPAAGHSAACTVMATHRVATRGTGRVVRLPEHTSALENVVLAAFNTDRSQKTKVNRPEV